MCGRIKSTRANANETESENDSAQRIRNSQNIIISACPRAMGGTVGWRFGDVPNMMER